MSIAFKARSAAPYFLLSNFYGGSEFTYMSMRTKNQNPNLRDLYISLRDNMDYETFKRYREKLAQRKYYKEGYTDAYAKTYDGKQYYGFGILAKLISTCWKPNDNMKRRLKVVNEIAKERGLTGNIKQKDFQQGDAKTNQGYMKTALSIKFRSEPYKRVLLGTYPNKLYERQGNRGKPSPWAGEDGWLGKLLMEVRDELRYTTGLLGKRKRPVQLKF